MSYLNFAKEFIKKSKYGSTILAYLPKHIIYGNLYNEISNLYCWKDSNQLEKIDYYLRNRMVKTLSNALTNVHKKKKNVILDPCCITIDNVYDKLLQFPYTSKKQ